MLFSAVISEHFSENRMIISLVAAKIWYPKKCVVFWATLYLEYFLHLKSTQVKVALVYLNVLKLDKHMAVETFGLSPLHPLCSAML